MRTITLTAPSFWASALVNNDWSGIEDASERQAVKDWLKAEGLGDALDAKEIGFSRWHDAWAFCPAACDVCQYVFPVKEG